MVQDNVTRRFYINNSETLARQYNSVDFEVLHKDWLDYLPEKKALVMDIGAGSGRDANWLAGQGYNVVAVEPVVEFYHYFLKFYPTQNSVKNISWVVDELPDLNKLSAYANKVSLILLSAVWMHLSKQQRKKSIKTFSKLCRLHGLVIISLRYGCSPDERIMYPVSVEEIKELGEKYFFKIKNISDSDDKLERKNVFWKTIVLEKYQ